MVLHVSEAVPRQRLCWFWRFFLGRKIWRFPKIGVPQNGWFTMENPIKMDDLGIPLFFGNIHMTFGEGPFWGIFFGGKVGVEKSGPWA